MSEPDPKQPVPQHSDNPTHSGERGTAMLFVVVSIGALIAITAWATETGRMWQVKSQLQAVADVASLAGVGNLLTNSFQTVDQAGAKTAAAGFGPQHEVAGQALSISVGDIDAGSWDLATQVFTPLPASTDPNLVRAIRVRTRRDGTANGPVPTILGNAIGVASVNVNSESVAYWGFAGTADSGVADLPIVFDCCAISGNSSGAACTQDYCNTITNNPPNLCSLSYGGQATCLEFKPKSKGKGKGKGSTGGDGEQNACWTAFDGTSSSVNTPDLLDAVANGNGPAIDGPIYLDNGVKTPVIEEIKDRFEGTGGYSPAEGTDTNGDGNVDSWVIKLAVVECQNPGAGCATGSPAAIVGFACFDLHEVVGSPDKVLKGDFLCASDPRCDNTGLGPGGTIPGAISAKYPVIVD